MTPELFRTLPKDEQARWIDDMERESLAERRCPRELTLLVYQTMRRFVGLHDWLDGY